MRLSLLPLLLVLPLGGCATSGGAAEKVPVFPRVPMPWSERGEYSDPVGGISARTCLGFAETRDLPWVGVAIRNASDSDVRLTETGAPPFNGAQGVQLLLDGEVVPHDASNPKKALAGEGWVEIRPDHVLMVGPIVFLERPSAGAHAVSAVYTVWVDGEEVQVTSPALTFEVPAED